MKKALFIDRDGTIIVEPPVTEQVDTLQALEFVPGAISALALLRSLPGHELVLASNQDGLGTPAFPTEAFEAPHRKMLRTLQGEGVTFDAELIDTHRPCDNSPCRKPGTGMFTRYLSGDYDLAASWVVGDRATDMQLAANLGCRGVLLALGSDVPEVPAHLQAITHVARSWADAAAIIRLGARRVELRRTTRETDVTVRLDLDGSLCTPAGPIATGLRFLDHMLEQIATHGGVGLSVEARGDLDVDEHHTVEDVAITLGQALGRALGSLAGAGRYGFALPMDDCRALVLLDFGGRDELVWDVEFRRERVGDVPTELWRHFFRSLCSGARCNIYVQARGDNDHHRIEAVFKALARALRQAVARNAWGGVPSSKGVL